MNEITMFSGMIFKKYNDKYYCNGAFGRFLDKMSKKYDRIYLCVPVKELDYNGTVNDYNVTSDNLVIQSLPPYNGFIGGLKNSKLIKKAIREHSKHWTTAIYIRWPVPFSKYVYDIAKEKKMMVCFHIVGDTKTIVTNGDKYNGLKKKLAILYATLNELQMKKMLKNSVALVNGSGLRRLYSSNNNIKEIRTSTFQKSEIFYRANKIESRVNILYVGYMRHEKGVPFLLEAINDLNEKGFDAHITLVGDGDRVTEYKNLASDLNIISKTNFKGHIPLGEALLSEYRSCNIFVLPSISEGTPRVLIEAMASGAAVIATNTGGIPFTVKNGENGLLVPVENYKEISSSIKYLLENQDSMTKLINNGYKFAEKNTLENHVDEVYAFIKEKTYEFREGN